MPGLPAELAPRLFTAQPLVQRVTPRPFAEFGRDVVGGGDLRLRRAEALCKSALDAATASERARQVTACPRAISSATMLDSMMRGPPRTRTRTLLSPYGR